VLAWGINNGTLGLKNPQNEHDRAWRSTPPTQVASALEGQAVKSVHAGPDFSACVTVDGRLFTWGFDSYGQLGLGRPTRIATAPQQVLGMGFDDTAGEAKVDAVACGENHMLVLTQSGQVWAQGMGREGQLGHGSKTDESVPFLISGGQEFGGAKCVAVAAGGAHSAAITADGRVFMWGKGRAGQLGRGGELESVASCRTTPTELSIFQRPPLILHAAQVACGFEHTIALLSDKPQE
jgi:alpha-tubulin suppressor-like RCC1 family protein